MVEQLDKLCLATERDRPYHFARAMQRYLESEEWHTKAPKAEEKT